MFMYYICTYNTHIFLHLYIILCTWGINTLIYPQENAHGIKKWSQIPQENDFKNRVIENKENRQKKSGFKPQYIHNQVKCE
jgi:hypothetical protein